MGKFFQYILKFKSKNLHIHQDVSDNILIKMIPKIRNFITIQ
jgi:hypothetical protein